MSAPKRSAPTKPPTSRRGSARAVAAAITRPAQQVIAIPRDPRRNIRVNRISHLAPGRAGHRGCAPAPVGGKLTRGASSMLRFSTDPDVAEQQMNAIIFYLTAFGYIDGEFDLTEKTFVKIYIRQLVGERARLAMPDADAKTRADVTNRFVSHFHEVFEQIDTRIRELFTEVVADQEKVEDFVYAKLKLRCYEIFNGFDADNQKELLRCVDELIYADGSVHPSEAKFRAEIEALLDSEIPLDAGELEIEPSASVEILSPVPLHPRAEDHPLLAGLEVHYSADPERL